MITDGSIDRFDKLENEANKEKERYIDLDTVEHTDARKVGAEWLCKQAIDQLEIDKFLKQQRWSKMQINTALLRLDKTDLNLRPIYHQRDDRCEAHLFFGLLSYWVVNTIRLQLKRQDKTAFWSEIVRRMSTQKLVTTKAINALGNSVELCQCSEPSKEARAIYRMLGYKEAPFKKIKFVGHNPQN